jgi:hypothetical protein
MINHDFSAFLYANGSTAGWLKLGTKNTSSVNCESRLLLAKL